MSIEFLITSLIVVVSPGTGVLYTLAAGLRAAPAPASSRRSAARSASCRTWPRRSLGLAALLHTSALAFQIFKYLGVAYLLYMAWSTLRERGALRVEPEIGAALGRAGDRRGDPDQHPQSEAVDLLPRVPAAVRARRTRPIRSRACSS